MTRLLCRIALAFAMPGARVRWVENYVAPGFYCQIIIDNSRVPMCDGAGDTPHAAFRDAMAKMVKP